MRALICLCAVLALFSAVQSFATCTPSAQPVYEAIGGDEAAGTREMAVVSFVGTTCNISISQLDASVVGQPTSDELATFGAWKTSDGTCATSSLTAAPVFISGVVGLNQYKISDNFRPAAGVNVIIPYPGSGNVICIGFRDVFSTWYESFNFNFSYVN